MATSISWDMQPMDIMLPYKTLRTRLKNPVVVDGYTPISHQQMILRPARLDDPPILSSLPLLMNQHLKRVV